MHTTAANDGKDLIWDSCDSVFFYLLGSLAEVLPSSDGVMCQRSELIGSQPGLHRCNVSHRPLSRSRVADTDYPTEWPWITGNVAVMSH